MPNIHNIALTLPLIHSFDDDKNVVPPYRIEGNAIYVSSETGVMTADYYGEFRGGFPWINPALETWAEANGTYWDWQNPGEIVCHIDN